MRIHCLQHVAFEGPANIENWALEREHPFQITRFYRDEQLPSLEEFEVLVVLGGPMNIEEEDEHPWLRDEKEFIRKAIEAGKPVLGVCLGAQLISRVLGNPVSRNPEPEIGWHLVEWTPEARKHPLLKNAPASVMAFHWHFDTFQIPSGAERLAKSEACANQAYILGDRVVGLQFHAEMTRESVQEMIDHCGNDLTDRPYVQRAEQMLPQEEHLKASKEFVYGFLDRFVALTAAH